MSLQEKDCGTEVLPQGRQVIRKKSSIVLPERVDFIRNSRIPCPRALSKIMESNSDSTSTFMILYQQINVLTEKIRKTNSQEEPSGTTVKLQSRDGYAGLNPLRSSQSSPQGKIWVAAPPLTTLDEQ